MHEQDILVNSPLPPERPDLFCIPSSSISLHLLYLLVLRALNDLVQRPFWLPQTRDGRMKIRNENEQKQSHKCSKVRAKTRKEIVIGRDYRNSILKRQTKLLEFLW